MPPLINTPYNIQEKMTTYNLRNKTTASTGQKVIKLNNDVRVNNLENRINNQEQKQIG